MLRRQRKRLILAGLLFFCFGVASNVEAKHRNSSYHGTSLSATDKQHILNDKFVLVKTVKQIPQAVQSQMFGNGPRTGMADAGQPFEVTDAVIGKPLPFSRLVFAAVSPGCCLVYSEYGGIAYGTKVWLYHTTSQKAILVWRAYPVQSGRNLLDLPQLREAVRKGRYRSE